jgi:hypothetical protein
MGKITISIPRVGWVRSPLTPLAGQIHQGLSAPQCDVDVPLANGDMATISLIELPSGEVEIQGHTIWNNSPEGAIIVDWRPLEISIADEGNHA